MIFSAPGRILRVGISLFIVIGLFLNFAPKTYAQNNGIEQYLTPNIDDNVPKNINVYVQSIFINLLTGFTCQLTGVDFSMDNTGCLGINMKTGKIGILPKEQRTGLLPVVNSMIASTYIIPIHSVDYASYISGNFITEKNKIFAAEPPTINTRAVTTQGLGFQGLSPFIKIWIGFRDFIYIIFVVLFVFIGLGIMLRVKLDAKSTLSIENAIPKVIIALLLITFSFAIAGFLIDVMYLLTYVVINLSSTIDPTIKPLDIFQDLNQTPIGFVNTFWGRTTFTGTGKATGFGILAMSGQATFGIVAGIWAMLEQIIQSDTILSVLFQFLGALNILCWPWKHFSLVPPSWGLPTNQELISCGTEPLVAILSILIFLAVFFAIIISLIRIWFELLKAYIYILFEVVLAPFMIGLGILPGSTMGFGSWVRGLAANLSVYPSTVFLILMSRMFMNAMANTAAATAANPTAVSSGIDKANALFSPPLMGGGFAPVTSPLFEGVSGVLNGTNFIGALLGLGTLALTPHFLKMIRDALKAPHFETAVIGETLGAGAAIGGALGARALRLGDARRGIEESPFWRPILGDEGNPSWLRKFTYGVANKATGKHGSEVKKFS